MPYALNWTKGNSIRSTKVEWQGGYICSAPTGALAQGLTRSLEKMYAALEEHVHATKGNVNKFKNAVTMDKLLASCLRKDIEIMHIDEYPKFGLHYIKAALFALRVRQNMQQGGQPAPQQEHDVPVLILSGNKRQIKHVSPAWAGAEIMESLKSTKVHDPSLLPTTEETVGKRVGTAVGQELQIAMSDGERQMTSPDPFAKAPRFTACKVFRHSRQVYSLLHVSSFTYRSLSSPSPTNKTNKSSQPFSRF